MISVTFHLLMERIPVNSRRRVQFCCHTNHPALIAHSFLSQKIEMRGEENMKNTVKHAVTYGSEQELQNLVTCVVNQTSVGDLKNGGEGKRPSAIDYSRTCRINEEEEVGDGDALIVHTSSGEPQTEKKFLKYFKWTKWMSRREEYPLFIFSPKNKLRLKCVELTEHKGFDYAILFFISLNCVTLAMERPKVPPWSLEREFLNAANYVFTIVFALEMAFKVVAHGLMYGEKAYFKSGWNIMDGILVGISMFDLTLSFVAQKSPKIFGVFRVFRLLRSLRPLRYEERGEDELYDRNFPIYHWYLCPSSSQQTFLTEKVSFPKIWEILPTSFWKVL